MIQEKLVDEISLNFPELFIIGKYVKIRFKNFGSPWYFIGRGQKIKNLTKIEHMRLLLFTFLGLFFVVFSRKNWFTQYINDLTLCLAHHFSTRSSIKLDYFRSLCEKMA